ncbi:MAG: T9SS type A sorting domain-containing protein [Candidatus Aegiribacteria sp.]|nr:T9SS type A sorting domain-containing protein [Candidatus Aegiribacteria sp.]
MSCCWILRDYLLLFLLTWGGFGKYGQFQEGIGGLLGRIGCFASRRRDSGKSIVLLSETAPSIYPNPSTEGIYIGFNLTAGPVDAELAIFDLTGQVVFESVKTGIGPGSFRAPLPEEAFYWDGICNDGSLASSGVYFVSLRTGDIVNLLKCSLVR